MASYDKELMTKELKDKFQDAAFLIVTSFKGLSAIEMSELRRRLDLHSSEYLVIKNRIARLVLKSSLSTGRETDLSKCVGLIDGPVGLTIGRRSPEGVSKLLINFIKSHGSLVIRGGLLEEGLVSTDYIKELASLPTRDVLLATVVRGLNAPIGGLVNILNQVIKKFVIVIDKVREKIATAEGAEKKTTEGREGKTTDEAEKKTIDNTEKKTAEEIEKKTAEDADKSAPSAGAAGPSA